MIVNIEQFNKYTNTFTDNEELQKSYLQSAQNIVSSYLSYDVEKKLLNSLTGELEEIIEIPEIIKLTINNIKAFEDIISKKQITI